MEEEKKVEQERKDNIFKKFGRKVKKTSLIILDKAFENPQVTMPLITGFGMLLGGSAKMILGAGDRRTERCKVQDDVTEEYFITTHPLTNDEILELGNRMIDGESKGGALKDMGVLKEEKRRK